MLKQLQHALRRLLGLYGDRDYLNWKLGELPRADDLKLQLGAMQCKLQQFAQPTTAAEAEFKVFSQWGEDGILQWLVNALGPSISRRFIEFGVENYVEASTRFLLQNNNWTGLVIDGSSEAMDSLKQRGFFWQHDLTAVASFITAENINEIITKAGFAGPLGILSVDIDGNDYWVWKAITVVDPAIVIVEYNSIFGPRRKVTIPYNPTFQRTAAHYSNLYQGCSIAALAELGKSKGYRLVGSNSVGNNAFFVKESLPGAPPELTPEQAYVESKFRESRGANGQLTWLTGAARLREIADMPMVDLETGKTIRAGEIAAG